MVAVIATACPKCGWVHVARDAVALSKFAGVAGFRTSDGEIHASREDAQEWLCEQRQMRSRLVRSERGGLR